MIQLDDQFRKSLPADPIIDNYRRQVGPSAYSLVSPTPVSAPKLVEYWPEVARLVGLDDNEVRSQEMINVLSGNGSLPGMQPWAACYGGHQFGNWAGQLGDGRAISIGEVVHDNRRWELQLKGAGPTPYSRMGDGRAVLRSSVREFLCSEAMYHLGVPTTRALSLVLTGDAVVRDMFYDGNPEPEPGAIVCRVAPSFVRFGNFQIFAARQATDTLESLMNFVLDHHFPNIRERGRDGALALIDDVVRTTIEMVVGWMRVGFVHGVMNTDNMSVHGLTIDYGPYGWLDDFDPGWTPNTTDAAGKRYSFGNQPGIAQWNVIRFAEALHPVVNSVPDLEQAVSGFAGLFQHQYLRMMADKIGLNEVRDDSDRELIEALPPALSAVETDMTLFFRRLAGLSKDAPGVEDWLKSNEDIFYDANAFESGLAGVLRQWLVRYQDRLRHETVPDHLRAEQMNRVNPKYVLRNYLAQQAINDATHGDYSELGSLMSVIRQPYDEQPGREKYAAKRPDWARDAPGCSMLSCSS